MKIAKTRLGYTLALAAALWSASSLSLQAQEVYRYYEVVRGDTIYSIAQRYGVDTKELLRVNAQTIVNGQGIQAGAILLIPSSSVPPPPPAPPAPQNLHLQASVAQLQPPAPHKLSVAAPQEVALAKPALKSKIKTKRRSSKRRSWRQPSVPAPENIAIGSDGRVVKIPAYVDPRALEEELEAIDSQAVASLLRRAKSYMGVPYVWGGESPDGFDCSGYMQYLSAFEGVNPPRTADLQFNAGEVVDAGQEAPGDMVFFETYLPGPSHVGIYLGQGEFIHASSSGCVKVSSLEEDYFRARYLGAKRVLYK